MMSRLLPLLLLLAGCGDDPQTAIRLRLTANPELNSEPQVVAALDRIEIVFDSPDGFGNIPAGGGKVGPLTARDVDSDGVQELVLDEPAAGEGFPLLRLLPGHNLVRDFSIRAVGFSGSRAAAVGGATAVSFTEGESLDVSVPLDLCDGFLPPRVLYTVPGAGEALDEDAAARLGEIRVYFSREVDPGSLSGNLRVIDAASGKSPEGSWTVEKLTAPCLGTAEHRSLAVLQLSEPCGLESGTYRVEAGSGVLDTLGAPLDQTALQPGANSFSSSFTVSRTTPPGGCIGSGGLCGSDQDCEAEKRCDLDPTSPTYKSCVWREGAGGSACGTCPTGYVCAITSTGPTCLRDCRSAGACAGTETCDPKTGLCQAS